MISNILDHSMKLNNTQDESLFYTAMKIPRSLFDPDYPTLDHLLNVLQSTHSRESAHLADEQRAPSWSPAHLARSPKPAQPALLVNSTACAQDLLRNSQCVVVPLGQQALCALEAIAAAEEWTLFLTESCRCDCFRRYGAVRRTQGEDGTVMVLLLCFEWGQSEQSILIGMHRTKDPSRPDRTVLVG